jgi:cytochrome c556
MTPISSARCGKAAAATVFVALGVLALSGRPAVPHTGATGPVKHRMEIMKSMGAAAKTIQAMLTGKHAYDKALLARLANEIAGHVPKLPKLFPKGSTRHPSEATPAIWTDWAGFNASLTTLQVEARKLAEIAPGGSRAEVVGQFRRVGQSCSGCHRDFRKKKR